MPRLNALEEYIHAQRALVERAQADLERLRKLRHRAASNPNDVFSSCLNCGLSGHTAEANGQLNADNTSHGLLGDLFDEVRGGGESKIRECVDWKLFEGQGMHVDQVGFKHGLQLLYRSILPANNGFAVSTATSFDRVS